MAYTTVINNKTSSIGSPTMYYTLQLEAVNRTSTSVDINYILNVQMKNSASLSGYNVNFNAIIKVGAASYEFNFKSKNDYWEGILSKTFTGTFTVSASAGVTSLATSLRTYSYGYSSAAGGTLNETSGTSITIPNVASTCSLSRTSITGGNTFTATVSNPQAGAEFQIQVVKGNTILATATGTHTFDGTLTWANQLTTAMTNELEVVFNTYLDGQLIDTQRKPLTYIVPSYTIDSPEINFIWHNRLGSKNVQGYTSFDYTLTGGTSKYGASTEFYVTFNGIQYVGSSATGLACTTVGTLPLTIQVLDSRGQTKEISQDIVVYSYAPPSIRSVAPVIANNVCTLQVGYEFSSVDGVNSATITGTIEEKSDTSSTSVTSASGTANVVMTKTYYGDNTLEGVCSIADGLGNTTIYNFVIPTENVPLDLNASGLGLAIGKVSEGTDGLVEINWDVQIGNEDTNLTFTLNGQEIGSGSFAFALERTYTASEWETKYGHSTESYGLTDVSVYNATNINDYFIAYGTATDNGDLYSILYKCTAKSVQSYGGLVTGKLMYKQKIEKHKPKLDLLWSGSSNGNFTFSANYDDYDYFVCFPIVTTSAVPLTCIVFKDMLATSSSGARNIQATDEAYFYTATLYRSGTTTMGIGNRNASNTNCKMTRIYGVKL